MTNNSIEIRLDDCATLIVSWESEKMSLTEIMESDGVPGSAVTISMDHDDARRLHQFILASLMKSAHRKE